MSFDPSQSSSSSERKTIREAIKEGVDENLAKNKYFESQQNSMEKIEIKYSKEAQLRNFNEPRANQYGEDARAAKYFNVAFQDIRSLFYGIFGGKYEPKNDFSFSQKQKILSYLYFKNKADLDSPMRMQAAYGGIEAHDAQVYALENRLAGIQKLKFDNRIIYVNSVAQCSNRIRSNGFLWGIFASSIIWGTFMKKQSLIRKVCMTLTLTHIGGQVASYRSIDRIFDSLYPLFQQDYEKFFEDERVRDEEHQTAGGIKSDPISNMIHQSMVQIRQGQKDQSMNQKPITKEERLRQQLKEAESLLDDNQDEDDSHQ